MAISVGDEAPDFTLPGTGGRQYTLSSYRGSPVVLAFYPADNSPVCTVQLTSYTQDLSSFEALGVTLLGISPQSADSHESFSDKKGLGFPLLADTDKAVGAAYGILGPLGFYRRSIFVVGADGRLRYVHRALAGATFKKAAEILANL